MAKYTQAEVLKYHDKRLPQGLVKRHFLNWRKGQIPAIPFRCDCAKCQFYSSELVWIGEPLKLILDHLNGVCGDNRPKNLQLLCPNCNSQQLTHGGKNKGRVGMSSGGFYRKDDEGKRHFVLPIEPGIIKITGSPITMTVRKADRTIKEP